MTVTPHERLRFFVTSRTGRQPYLVDLGSYAGNGCCDCANFKFKLRPALRQSTPGDDFRCAHILAARRWFFEDVLDRFIAEFRRTHGDYPEDS